MNPATPLDHGIQLGAPAGASLHRQGITGRGIGIAVIDSGVRAPGELGRRIIEGPDFTADVLTDESGRDHTGHGTHLAGIAAGRSVGVAPGAHVVSLKAASAGGSTDVEAVIAALEWAIAHRHDLGIGVVLVAFGADQLPLHRFDPLAAAVARAWGAGLVVVTSAGNGGQEAPLSTPAHIPEVITVAGAEQVDGRWMLCDFSDRGVPGCRPDLAAPARSLVGPIAPGSEAESAPESSVVAEGYVKGTGTSQAAAAVAGAAALLLEADPSLTPDEVKRVLTVSAARMDDDAAGAGAMDLDVALACLASGLFRFDAAPVPAGAWAGHSWRGHSWRGHSWRGHSWRGHSWRGLEWAGHSWRGHSWRGLEWAGHSWRGHSWRGHSWRGHSWRGLEWAGHSWRGHSWRGLEWAGHSWRGHSWRGHSWRGLEWAGHSWRGHSWRGLEWA
jgi:serine protease AprX